MKAMFLFSILMGTFILLSFTISVILGLTIDSILTSTCVINISSMLVSSYLRTSLLGDRVLCWLRSSCWWAQVKLRTLLPGVQRYEKILNRRQKARQMIRASSSYGSTRIEILFTIVTFYMLQMFNSVGTPINILVISTSIWILKRQTRRSYADLEHGWDTVSWKQLSAEERYLQISSTEIIGILSTATIHNVYEIQLSSSLTFCQLKPDVRRAIISRIVSDILAYDNTMSHISSPTDTFAPADRIIQYRFSADWFERSIRF